MKINALGGTTKVAVVSNAKLPHPAALLRA